MNNDGVVRAAQRIDIERSIKTDSFRRVVGPTTAGDLFEEPQQLLLVRKRQHRLGAIARGDRLRSPGFRGSFTSEQFLCQRGALFVGERREPIRRASLGIRGSGIGGVDETTRERIVA